MAWLNTVGGLSLGYGTFLALWAINLLRGYTLGRHTNAPPVRPLEWANVAVSIAAAVALLAVGVLIYRRDSSPATVRVGLSLSGIALMVKAVVVGWMVASFFRNPSGPLDGLAGALIPLSIVPGVLWAFVQLSAAIQLGRSGTDKLTQIRELDVSVSGPAETSRPS